MTTKKKPEQHTAILPKEDSSAPQTKLPLVFISHDTRDAEIAEAVSKLLSSVSAGVLKSFRSSDRRGSQGIEYGVEWFPEIMKRLDEASDIVCLLTQHSIDRPWILYEAGVAKGKLNTTVLGISLGIPLNKASSGPFAQFQNCADDEDSLTKLVMQLVKRIPNAEPEEEIVRDQVKVFKQKLSELLAKQSGNIEVIDPKGETSTAKLFEEVKIMFQDLPSRIDRRLDPEMMIRRKRRLHPGMVKELMHFGLKRENPYLSFLIILSIFKEDAPWLYEIGVETYHALKNAKTKPAKQKAISNFENAFEMFNHPIFQEMYVRSEETYIMYKELRNTMHRYIEQFLDGGESDQSIFFN
jgi:hypothetical protein